MSGALYTITVRADGTTITGAIYTADHQKHVDNGDAAHLGGSSDDVTAMRALVNPGAVGSEVLPTSIEGEIQRIRYVLKAIGGGTQWYDPVATGAAFLDTVHAFTKRQSFTPFALTDAATIAWDLNVAQFATVTLGGNRLFGLPTNIVDGATYILRTKQDATGTRVPTWNAAFDFGADGTPVLTTVANKFDYLTFVGRGTTKLDFLGIKKGFT